jgi:DNA-binding GntR family transcriptional regulator
MTIDEVLAVYAVREGLEGIAARTVAARPAPGLIDALHDVQRRMTEDLGSPASTMAAHNLEFHRLIREATGNPYLERFLTQVEHAVRRFGRSTFALSGRPEQALEEHFGIIEAIAAGAPELAEERAVRHMRNARETRIAQMLAG